MLTPAYHAIKQQLLSAPIVHADETSHIRGNENRWLLQMCTDKLSCFMAHHSRGQVAAKKLLGENAEYVVITANMRGITIMTKTNGSYVGCIFYVMSALAQGWGINVAIGKRIEIIVNMLFRTRHRLEDRDITELIYQR
jgi:transposase